MIMRAGRLRPGFARTGCPRHVERFGTCNYRFRSGARS